MAAHPTAGTKLVLDPFKEATNTNHWEISESLHLGFDLPTILGYQISKFHILIALAATLVAVSMIWIGRRMATGEIPRGKMWNLLESLLYFVREKIAKPGLGHDADKYVPFLTALFLLILIMNLLGMIPFLGSATASLAVTFGLATVSFVVIHASGIKQMGAGKYATSFIPHLHLEGGPLMQVMGFMIKWGMAALEYMTVFIRYSVLAIRLFANMLAGHVALFMLLFFIQLSSRLVSGSMGGYYEEVPGWVYYVVTPFSILLATALSLLEIFVACLQAFVFTLLTSIFIGLAKHPAH